MRTTIGLAGWDAGATTVVDRPPATATVTDRLPATATVTVNATVTATAGGAIAPAIRPTVVVAVVSEPRANGPPTTASSAVIRAGSVRLRIDEFEVGRGQNG